MLQDIEMVEGGGRLDCGKQWQYSKVRNHRHDWYVIIKDSKCRISILIYIQTRRPPSLYNVFNLMCLLEKIIKLINLVKK